MKQKIHDGALNFLKSIQDKHTKMSNLNYQELKCSKYLLDNRLSNEDKKLLFKFRTRMYTVKANFRTQFKDKLDCKLCKSAIESQAHLFECNEIKNMIPELKSNSKVKYEHIFGNIGQMREVVKILQKICAERESQIEELNDALCKQQPSH